MRAGRQAGQMSSPINFRRRARTSSDLEPANGTRQSPGKYLEKVSLFCCYRLGFQMIRKILKHTLNPQDLDKLLAIYHLIKGENVYEALDGSRLLSPISSDVIGCCFYLLSSDLPAHKTFNGFRLTDYAFPPLRRSLSSSKAVRINRQKIESIESQPKVKFQAQSLYSHRGGTAAGNSRTFGAAASLYRKIPADDRFFSHRSKPISHDPCHRAVLRTRTI